MKWVPESAWLTKVVVDSAAGDLKYDLAVDANGDDPPSAVAAGLARDEPRGEATRPSTWQVIAAWFASFVALGVVVKRSRAVRP
jgi:hypothetical protein